MKEIDGQRLNALMEKCLEDMAAASSGVLVVIGDRLGLFTAIAQKGAVSAGELAQITGTAERMVREWLAAMAASGYVVYDVQEATYSMTSEQIALLADPNSPFLLTGVYRCIAGLYKDEPIVCSAFRHGSGVGWHEHHEDLFVGTEEFFGRVYENFLVPAWLPSLEDVTEKLIRGGSVADIGCGHGASTLIMARSFPKSHFYGFDAHEESIRVAEQRRLESGLQNVVFQSCPVHAIPQGNYDLALFLDSFHEMGTTMAVAAYVRSLLSRNGTLMLVEQKAGDRLEDNLHPGGRLCLSFSTMICVPAAISQGEKDALGAQAGPRRLEEVLRGGGFTRIRKTCESPLHMVIDAKCG